MKIPNPFKITRFSRRKNQLCCLAFNENSALRPSGYECEWKLYFK